MNIYTKLRSLGACSSTIMRPLRLSWGALSKSRSLVRPITKRLLSLSLLALLAPSVYAQDVSLTLTTDGDAVRMTGPWWSWDASGGPEAVSNGDGTWTVTMAAPTENMEYLWVVDGVQENLIDNAAGAECSAEIDAGALITDYSGWANRVLVLDSGDASNTYDACAGTAAPSTGVDLTLTTDGSAVRMTGPWWSWDPNGGPEAVDNGDGTWTVTLDPAPTDNMESHGGTGIQLAVQKQSTMATARGQFQWMLQQKICSTCGLLTVFKRT